MGCVIIRTTLRFTRMECFARPRSIPGLSMSMSASPSDCGFMTSDISFDCPLPQRPCVAKPVEGGCTLHGAAHHMPHRIFYLNRSIPSLPISGQVPLKVGPFICTKLSSLWMCAQSAGNQIRAYNVMLDGHVPQIVEGRAL